VEAVVAHTYREGNKEACSLEEDPSFCWEDTLDSPLDSSFQVSSYEDPFPYREAYFFVLFLVEDHLRTFFLYVRDLCC